MGRNAGWYTWALAQLGRLIGNHSMKGGFIVIIIFIVLALVIGFIIGKYL